MSQLTSQPFACSLETVRIGKDIGKSACLSWDFGLKKPRPILLSAWHFIINLSVSVCEVIFTSMFLIVMSNPENRNCPDLKSSVYFLCAIFWFVGTGSVKNYCILTTINNYFSLQFFLEMQAKVIFLSKYFKG